MNDKLFVSRFLTVAARVRMTSDAEHLRFFPIRAICEIRGFNCDSNRPPVVDARRADTTSARGRQAPDGGKATPRPGDAHTTVQQAKPDESGAGRTDHAHVI